MTTPTTMTTSMITTATATTTDVVVAPSLGGVLVGCVLLLTGAVPVVIIIPTVWGEVVAGYGVVALGVDAVEMKRITWYYSTIHKNAKICDPLSENLAHRAFYENRDKTGNRYTNV